MRFSAILIAFSIFMFLPGCQNAGELTTSSSIDLDERDSASPHTATMWVRGMGCPQCAYNVDLQLLKVPGVDKVKVDMSSGKVTAQLSPDNPPSREQLAAAIKETGFTLVKIEMGK